MIKNVSSPQFGLGGKKPDGKVENTRSIWQRLNRFKGVSHFPTGSATITKHQPRPDLSFATKTSQSNLLSTAQTGIGLPNAKREIQ
jgi:hypothetical protein